MKFIILKKFKIKFLLLFFFILFNPYNLFPENNYTFDEFENKFNQSFEEKNYEEALDILNVFYQNNTYMGTFLDKYYLLKIYKAQNNYESIYQLSKFHIDYEGTDEFDKMFFINRLLQRYYFDGDNMSESLHNDITIYIRKDITDLLIENIKWDQYQDKEDKFFYYDLFYVITDLTSIELRYDNYNPDIVLLADYAYSLLNEKKLEEYKEDYELTINQFYENYLKILYQSKNHKLIETIFNKYVNHFKIFKGKNSYYQLFFTSEILFLHTSYLSKNDLPKVNFYNNFEKLIIHINEHLDIFEFIEDLATNDYLAKSNEDKRFFIDLASEYHKNIEEKDLSLYSSLSVKFFYYKFLSNFKSISSRDLELFINAIDYYLKDGRDLENAKTYIPSIIYILAFYDLEEYPEGVNGYFNYLEETHKFINYDDRTFFDAIIATEKAQYFYELGELESFNKYLNKSTDLLLDLSKTKYKDNEIFIDYQNLVISNFNNFDDPLIIEKRSLEFLSSISELDNYAYELNAAFHYSNLLGIFCDLNNLEKAKYYFSLLDKLEINKTNEFARLLHFTNTFKFYAQYENFDKLFDYYNSDKTAQLIDEIMGKNENNNTNFYFDIYIVINSVEVALHAKDPNYKFSDRWFKINDKIISYLENLNSVDARVRSEYWKVMGYIALIGTNYDNSNTENYLKNINTSIASLINIFDQYFLNTNTNFDNLNYSYKSLWASFMGPINFLKPNDFEFSKESLLMNSLATDLLELKYKNEFYKSVNTTDKVSFLDDLHNRSNFFRNLDKENINVFKPKNFEKFDVELKIYNPKENELLIYLNNILDDIFVTFRFHDNIEITKKIDNSKELIIDIDNFISEETFYKNVKENKFNYKLSYKITNNLFGDIRNILADTESYKNINTLIIVKDSYFKNLPINSLTTDISLVKGEDLKQQKKAKWLFEEFNLINFANPFFSLSKYDGDLNNYAAFAINDFNGSNKLISKIYRDSNMLSFDFTKLPNLPFANKEIINSSRIFDNETNIDLFINSEANEENFYKLEKNKYELLHFATHAISGNKNQASAIVLSPKNEKNFDGILTPYEIAKSNVQADIVILSACSTAFRRNNLKYGIDGLVQGFFFNDSKAIMATIFPIEDQFTSYFLPKFLNNFLIDTDKSLSRSYNKTIRDLVSGPKNYNPYFWSSFEIIHKNIY